MLSNLMKRIEPLVERLMYEEKPIENWKAARAGWNQFSVAGANLAPNAETMHTMVAGLPGHGKTVAKMERLDQVRKYKQPAIVYDKKREFIEAYYRPGYDIILDPFDERSPAWNPWVELRHGFDSSAVAAALIELPTSGDPYWAQNARSLLRDLLLVLQREGLATNEALYKYATTIPLDELYKFLKGTQGGQLMDSAGEKTAFGIRTQLGAFLSAFPFLTKGGEPFSVRQFVAESGTSDRWLFLPSRGDVHPITRPLISLWMELVGIEILSGPNGVPGRRIHLFLDEIPSLQKMPSIPTLAAEGRSFGACVTFGYQVYSQLEERWGKEAKTLVGLAGTWVVFKQGEGDGAKYLASGFGDQLESKKKVQNTQSSNEVGRDSATFSEEEKKNEAVMQGELTSLDVLCAYVKSPNMPSLSVRFKPVDREKVAEPFVMRSGLDWSDAIEASAKAAEVIEKMPEISVAAVKDAEGTGEEVISSALSGDKGLKNARQRLAAKVKKAASSSAEHSGEWTAGDDAAPPLPEWAKLN